MPESGANTATHASRRDKGPPRRRILHSRELYGCRRNPGRGRIALGALAAPCSTPGAPPSPPFSIWATRGAGTPAQLGASNPVSIRRLSLGVLAAPGVVMLGSGHGCPGHRVCRPAASTFMSRRLASNFDRVQSDLEYQDLFSLRAAARLAKSLSRPACSRLRPCRAHRPATDHSSLFDYPSGGRSGPDIYETACWPPPGSCSVVGHRLPGRMAEPGIRASR